MLCVDKLMSGSSLEDKEATKLGAQRLSILQVNLQNKTLISKALYFRSSYPAHACTKGLSNWFCPSVSLSVCQSVCLVKNFEI